MRVLITSGGTIVPIDPVRYIGNTSSGRFGAKLARCALQANAEVIYLTSAHAASPFSSHVNFYHNDKDQLEHIKQLKQFCDQYRQQYHEYRYHSFNDYASQLQSLIENQQPDIIILAAAVSDYLVANYTEEKIRSSDHLSLQLKTAPKVINAVKQWSDQAFVVGFKLLVNADDADLVAAANKSMAQHHLDLVVANDLASIRRGTHEVIIVEKNGAFQKYTEDAASHVIARALQR